jgi:hypothetical protein
VRFKVSDTQLHISAFLKKEGVGININKETIRVLTIRGTSPKKANQNGA